MEICWEFVGGDCMRVGVILLGREVWIFLFVVSGKLLEFFK